MHTGAPGYQSVNKIHIRQVVRGARLRRHVGCESSFHVSDYQLGRPLTDLLPV